MVINEKRGRFENTENLNPGTMQPHQNRFPRTTQMDIHQIREL